MLKHLLVVSLIVLYAQLTTSSAWAQWWNPFPPKDYEDCAARAAKDSSTPTALGVLLNNCASQFEGRRKPGGGYRFYVSGEHGGYCETAGPNPTSDERQKCEAQLKERFLALQARRYRAYKSVSTSDASIGCATPSCYLLSGTVTVTNNSDLNISRISIGWVIFPSGSKRSCPNSYPSKESFFVGIGPGESAAFNFTPLETTNDSFQYCVGIAGVNFDD